MHLEQVILLQRENSIEEVDYELRKLDDNSYVFALSTIDQENVIMKPNDRLLFVKNNKIKTIFENETKNSLDVSQMVFKVDLNIKTHVQTHIPVVEE